jgi:hypothetical protein
MQRGARLAGFFGKRRAYWTPSQAAYRFPTCGPFLWKLGAFWRPFSFRARYDRGATQVAWSR